MQRSSPRLLANGYYSKREKGEISYYEPRFGRPFNKRRRRRPRKLHDDLGAKPMNCIELQEKKPYDRDPPISNTWNLRMTVQKIPWHELLKLILTSGLLLLLINIHLSKVQKEVNHMKEAVQTLEETTEVPKIVNDVVQEFIPNCEEMEDHALESQGSSIIRSHCSETYPHHAVVKIFGIPIFSISTSPQAIIQPEMDLGKCWALKGNQGFATVRLARPVLITHVTLDHLPKELSPSGEICSAPKEFRVNGFRSESDTEGAPLGSFVFQYYGESAQTFRIMDKMRGVYEVVQLVIDSNWGNPDYTCIYRFRVHGQPQQRTPTTPITQ